MRGLEYSMMPVLQRATSHPGHQSPGNSWAESGPGPLCQPYLKAELSGKQAGKGSCPPLPARPAITAGKAVLTHYILPSCLSGKLKSFLSPPPWRNRRCKGKQEHPVEEGALGWIWCELAMNAELVETLPICFQFAITGDWWFLMFTQFLKWLVNFVSIILTRDNQ